VDKFLQLLVGGVALGGIYALVALGFVVVYASTRTINFAHGGFVLLGAYLTYNFAETWDLPFVVALFLAMATMALFAAILERLVLRRMVGKPSFTLVMVTLGMFIVIEQVVRAVWSAPAAQIHTPWSDPGDRVDWGGVSIQLVDLWTVGITAALLVAFFSFFRYSPTGLAMRAAAIDQEAASAQGISVSRVLMVSWAIAGVVAVVAGVMYSTGPGDSLSPAVGYVALRAFPAMILGGLDSPTGAVVGGVTVGVTEVMTAGYLDQRVTDSLGANFHLLMPYLLLIAVLMVRPTGFFGSRHVERV
jgi:branched-chain amino acid transport system permease protein